MSIEKKKKKKGKLEIKFSLSNYITYISLIADRYNLSGIIRNKQWQVGVVWGQLIKFISI